MGSSWGTFLSQRLPFKTEATGSRGAPVGLPGQTEGFAGCFLSCLLSWSQRLHSIAFPQGRHGRLLGEGWSQDKLEDTWFQSSQARELERINGMSGPSHESPPLHHSPGISLYSQQLLASMSGPPMANRHHGLICSYLMTSGRLAHTAIKNQTLLNHQTRLFPVLRLAKQLAPISTHGCINSEGSGGEADSEADWHTFTQVSSHVSLNQETNGPNKIKL